MPQNDGNELPDIFSDAGRKYTGIGTAKDEIVHALNGLWIDSGRPAGRPLAQISDTLCKKIVLPEETGFKVPAICRRDQGAAIVPYWAAIYARHARGQKPARQLPPGVAALASPIEFALTESLRGFLASHGPHGKLLTARAELGHPRDRYRAALLLGTDNNHLDEAISLLLDVASTGYAPALDLLEALRSREHQRHRMHATLVTGRLAHHISGQAWLAGDLSQAYAFLIAAARGCRGRAPPFDRSMN